MGWHIEGYFPVQVPKAIFAVVPHTFWRDLPVGFASRMAMGIKIRFLAKKSLFVFPLGPVLRWVGGYPVDRKKHSNLVSQAAEVFSHSESFYLALAPEGTRKKVNNLKSGFYYMALESGVPLILTQLNFQNKTVVFADPWKPSGDRKKDFDYIYGYFSGIQGYYPEKSFYA